jgi:hypothetical protein
MAIYNHGDFSGLQIVDLNADPPTSTAHLLEDVDEVYAVAVDGSVAHLSAGMSGLIAVDVSDPQDVRVMGAVDTFGETRRSVLQDDLLYLANGTAGLAVAARPVEAASVSVASEASADKDKLSFDLPSPPLAGDYTIRLFDAESHAELPGAVTFSREARLFRSKAIIVAGGGPEASAGIWKEIRLAGDRAYEALTRQGYDRHSIRYYRVSETDEQVPLAGAPSFTDLRESVTNWAAVDAEDLLIYLVGHGESGKMILTEDPSGTTRLDVHDLATWLEEVQTLPGFCVTLIYDACFAGSFIPPLRRPQTPQRVLITSSAAYEKAHFPNLGFDSFSYHFWSSILNRGNLLEAYDAACDAVHGTQKPMLDADGDGRSDSKDRHLVRDRKVLRGWPGWVAVPTIGSLQVGPVPQKDALEIRALNVEGADGVTARVLPPDSAPADEGGVEIDLDPVGGGANAGLYAGAGVNGTYGVSVRAERTPVTPSVYCSTGTVGGWVPIHSPRRVAYLTRQEAGADPGMDDHEGDDDSGLADAITVDGDIPQDHSFHSVDDEDWVKFYAMAGERYTLVTGEWPACETMLELFHTDGRPAGLNPGIETDENGVAVGRYLDFPCQESGVYALKVSNGNAHFGWNARYDLSIYKPEAPILLVTVWGEISDPQGDPIAGVAVTTDDGASALSRSEPEGSFHLRSPAGPCRIRFERAGYQTRTMDIEVAAKKENYLAVTLEPGDGPAPEPEPPGGGGGGGGGGCFLTTLRGDSSTDKGGGGK